MSFSELVSYITIRPLNQTQVRAPTNGGKAVFAERGGTLSIKDSDGNVSVFGADTDAIHDNVSGEIAVVTPKATPVNADLVLIEDSADSNSKKRVQVGDLPFSPSAGVRSFDIALVDTVTIDVEANDALWGVLVVPSVGVDVSSMSCQVTQSSSGNVYFAIYDASFTKLGDESTGISCSTKGIKTASLSSTVSLTAGTPYYLCIRSDANGTRFAGHSSSSSAETPQYSINKNGVAASSFPSSFTSPTANGTSLWISGCC
jgi:hypothetical protein